MDTAFSEAAGRLREAVVGRRVSEGAGFARCPDAQTKNAPSTQMRLVDLK